MSELFDPEKLPDTDFRVPDLSQAVEGWRVWKCSITPPPFGVAPKLYSASSAGYYWAPRRLSIAHCEKCGEEDVPGERCACGFYSAKTFEHLMSMHYPNYNAEHGEVKILGQIANWGKVIEGTQGWRAQKAYPVRLWVPYEAARLVKPLHEHYGVPVRLRNFLRESMK